MAAASDRHQLPLSPSPRTGPLGPQLFDRRTRNVLLLHELGAAVDAVLAAALAAVITRHVVGGQIDVERAGVDGVDVTSSVASSPADSS